MPVINEQFNNSGLSPRELSLLLEISRVITSSLPYRNMFEVIHAYLKEIVNIDHDVLYIKEKGRLNVKVGLGINDKMLVTLGKGAGTNFLLKKLKLPVELGDLRKS